MSLRLHPDCGGEHDLMILLQESYENVPSTDERLKIIEEIIEYAKTHPKFNVAYTESIKAYGSENGYITSTQYNTLVKTYYAFRMDKKAQSCSSSSS